MCKELFISRLCHLILATVVIVSLSSCSREPGETPARARPPVSGIDLATFDKTVRPQDDAFMPVNGVWLAKTEIPVSNSLGAHRSKQN